MIRSTLTTLLTSSIVLLGTAQAGHANNFVAKMTAYKSCVNFPDSMKFNEKPSFCMNSEGKSVLAIVVAGKNIIGVKEKSLNATSVTLNGNDVSKNRMGNSTYKLGSFPKASEDGQFAVFDIELEGIPFGTLHDVRFNGDVQILTSERLIDLPKQIDTSQPFEAKVGNYVITNKPKLESLAGDAIGKMMSSAFSQKPNEGELPIRVIGDLEALVSLEATQNGQKVDQSWASWNDNTKTFMFKKPTDPTVDFQLKYWDGLKQETIKLAF